MQWIPAAGIVVLFEESIIYFILLQFLEFRTAGKCNLTADKSQMWISIDFISRSIHSTIPGRDNFISLKKYIFGDRPEHFQHCTVSATVKWGTLFMGVIKNFAQSLRLFASYRNFSPFDLFPATLFLFRGSGYYGKIVRIPLLKLCNAGNVPGCRQFFFQRYEKVSRNSEPTPDNAFRLSCRYI